MANFLDDIYVGKKETIGSYKISLVSNVLCISVWDNNSSVYVESFKLTPEALILPKVFSIMFLSNMSSPDEGDLRINSDGNSIKDEIFTSGNWQ